LNSAVNERRGRGFFFAMVSMIGILSRPKPHRLDVRYGGSTPDNPIKADNPTEGEA
jgi:hypothetical protein